MKLIIIIIVLVILAFLSMFLLQNLDFQPLLTPPVSENNSPTPTEMRASVPSDWRTYTGDGFTVSYDPDMEVSENPARFLLKGPTQTENTEVFDGVIVTLTAGSYPQDSLETFVEEERRKNEQEPAISEVSLIREVTFGDNRGYVFTVLGLGEFDHYYFQREGKYVHASVLVADPTNQGFEQIAEMMLSSLR